MRGIPRSPSRLSSSAVSSPQMYAPAPRCTTMSRSKPEPSMFVPRKPRAFAVGDRLGEPLVAERELAAQVDEREVALQRERGDGDALDELVRIALDEHAVLERRRLALVGVDHEVARERAGRQERPLLAGREARAAAAAQARRLHLLLHIGGIVRGDDRAELLVRAGRDRAVDRPRVVGTVVQPLGDDTASPERSSSGFPTRCEPSRAARLVVVDDAARPSAVSCARGTRSSPGARAHRRTPRGTRPLRR